MSAPVLAEKGDELALSSTCGVANPARRSVQVFANAGAEDEVVPVGAISPTVILRHLVLRSRREPADMGFQATGAKYQVRDTSLELSRKAKTETCKGHRKELLGSWLRPKVGAALRAG
ncbi:hypothetical protein ACHAQJ_001937 [Trichoderma viride]